MECIEESDLDKEDYDYERDADGNIIRTRTDYTVFLYNDGEVYADSADQMNTIVDNQNGSVTLQLEPIFKIQGCGLEYEPTAFKVYNWTFS